LFSKPCQCGQGFTFLLFFNEDNMNTKTKESIVIGQEILAELTKTANLLSNGCEGDKEKTLSVGFKSTTERTDLVADLSNILILHPPLD
jgi:hypothetical protein